MKAMMQATEISAAINPYSMAVAPLVSLAINVMRGMFTPYCSSLDRLANLADGFPLGRGGGRRAARLTFWLPFCRTISCIPKGRSVTRGWDCKRQPVLSARELRPRIRFERALASPPPQQQRPFLVITTQPCRRLDQQPEDHRTIVIGEFDQPRLCNEPAELDQLAGALASLHDPRACIMPRSAGEQPVARRRRPAKLKC